MSAPIKIEISAPLSAEDRERLCSALGCVADELPAALAGYGHASLAEYIQMFLGQKAFTRGSDMLEYRLFLLISYVFKRIPTEAEVSRLFQCTATESRGHIRAVMSKFQYMVQDPIKQTIKNTLEGTQMDAETGNHLVTINSVSIVEFLNRTLAGVNGNLIQITKSRGTVATYEISPASFGALKAHYGL